MNQNLPNEPKTAEAEIDKKETAAEAEDTVAFPAFPERSEKEAAAAIFTAMETASGDVEQPKDQPQTLFDDIDTTEYTDDAAEAPKEDTSAAEDADTVSESAISDADVPTADASNAKQKPRKKRIRWPWIALACVLFIVVGYLTVAFIPSGPIAGLRDIYIQTAMSTADHQWLATMLFPQSVIDAAWTDPSVAPPDLTDDMDFLEFLEPADPSQTPTQDPSASGTPSTDNSGSGTTKPNHTTGNTGTATTTPVTADVLGLNNLKVGQKDYAGNTLTVVNKEEGLFISEFTGKSSMILGMKYHGYVMLIDDPSRVFVGSTPEPGVTGYRIQQMSDYYGNIVAGMNASSFSDPNDEGTGGDIIGTCLSEGKSWGRYTNTMASIVLTKENKLVVGWLPDWSSYTNIRDGIQFGPVLVNKGKNVIDQKSGGGMGVHPRAAIGQRADGAIIMIVIDGRVSSSIGCTMWEMAEMMVKYGAVTAGGCDGGSSVVMSYGGKVLNSNSSMNPTYGRRLPNAFLVRSKKDS
ncbi:MAG: phosphodiester glycosidase family protein [Clostridia bacterium]|nr:phosphodiester glycosidase family protein [Clostridia bacterium]